MLVCKKQKKAFSLIELLVSIAIVGLLALLGMRSYKSQREKVIINSESKAQLSKIYMFETSFYQDWQEYHGNLIAIGAMPKGVLNYNMGFDDATVVKAIVHHPYLNISGNIAGCYNYKAICQACACGEYCKNITANQCSIQAESTIDNLNSKGEITSTTFKAEYVRELYNNIHRLIIDQDGKISRTSDNP